MFSFHKPRVYRSTDGCCICRAKSSSSRFTDSRKYEADSIKCFDLKNPRYGEICNACVLLVKRYKRLPSGNQRHWGHVVDARAGPGSKTITKIKRSKEESSSENSTTRSSNAQNKKFALSEKFSKIFKKSKNKRLKINSKDDRNGGVKTPNKSPNKVHSKMVLLKRPNSVESDDNNDKSRESSPGPVVASSQNNVKFQTQTRLSSYRSKFCEKPNRGHNLTKGNASIVRGKKKDIIIGSNRRKCLPPQKNRMSNDINVKFFDDAEWSKLTTCCGIVYESSKLPGAVIIDLDHLKLCQNHLRHKTPTIETFENQSEIEINQNQTIKTTLPAVVKLSLPSKDLRLSTQSTPSAVLKKHHLFYKRQSESFPHGDIGDIATTINQTTTKSKTEDYTRDKTTSESNSTETHTTSKIGITFCGTKSSNFLHKIKSDAGKIVKQSIEKLNSAVRLKAHNISDIKNLVTPIDKNCILSKTGLTNIRDDVTAVKMLKVPELSPTSSSSSTKFSDNSSDSGFDENIQDRKSVSPMQQENESKLVIRPPIQTLVLASGVRVHGQQQNLVYAGNDAAAKILQSPMLQQNYVTSISSNSTILQQNKRLNAKPHAIDSSTNFKLLSKPTNNSNMVSIGPYNVGGLKLRPLCNSNIALQHENGVTTTVPASSLDTAKQSDKIIEEIALNTISIAPSSSSLNQIKSPMNPSSTNFQNCNNDITNTQIRNNQCPLNLNTPALKQKYIVLKANSKTNFSHTNTRNNNKRTSDMI